MRKMAMNPVKKKLRLFQEKQSLAISTSETLLHRTCLFIYTFLFIHSKHQIFPVLQRIQSHLHNYFLWFRLTSKLKKMSSPYIHIRKCLRNMHVDKANPSLPPTCRQLQTRITYLAEFWVFFVWIQMRCDRYSSTNLLIDNSFDLIELLFRNWSCIQLNTHDGISQVPVMTLYLLTLMTDQCYFPVGFLQ